MRTTGRQPHRRSKTPMIIIVIVIILAALLAVGYFLWNQIPGAVKTASGQNKAVSASEDQSSVEYRGNTYKYNDHLSNYLFMGIDSSKEVNDVESQQDAGQADSIFVVSLDRAAEQVQVISIPRDTITEIEVFNPSGTSLGMTDNHINLQYAYGDGREKSCELMKTAVSKLLYDIPVQGYYAMNMSGISEVGKLVGDVEIIVPDTSLEEQDPYFREGTTVVINGDNVDEFLRYRDTGKSQSALVRQERQKTYLKALIPKLQEKMQTNSSFVGSLLDDIKPYTVTNLGNDVFVKLLNAAGNSTMEAQTIPGEGVEGKYYDEYHVNDKKLYELILSMFYNII